MIMRRHAGPRQVLGQRRPMQRESALNCLQHKGCMQRSRYRGMGIWGQNWEWMQARELSGQCLQYHMAMSQKGPSH